MQYRCLLYPRRFTTLVAFLPLLSFHTRHKSMGRFERDTEHAMHCLNRTFVIHYSHYSSHFKPIMPIHSKSIPKHQTIVGSLKCAIHKWHQLPTPTLLGSTPPLLQGSLIDCTEKGVPIHFRVAWMQFRLHRSVSCCPGSVSSWVLLSTDVVLQLRVRPVGHGNMLFHRLV